MCVGMRSIQSRCKSISIMCIIHDEAKGTDFLMAYLVDADYYYYLYHIHLHHIQWSLYLSLSRNIKII